MSAFRRVRSAGLSLTMAVITAGAVGLALAGPAQAATQSAAKAVASKGSAVKGADAVPLCGDAPKGQARCFALRRTDVAARKGAQPSLAVAGFGPADLQQRLQPAGGRRRGPDRRDRGRLRRPQRRGRSGGLPQQFGLPACTTANGCFSKVDQRGGTDYPAPDAGWAGEISLDLDMVSAVAPHAHILLVEADDNVIENLGARGRRGGGARRQVRLQLLRHRLRHHPGQRRGPVRDHRLRRPLQPPGRRRRRPHRRQRLRRRLPGRLAVRHRASAAPAWSATPAAPAAGRSRCGTTPTAARVSGCSLYEPKPAFQTDTGCANAHRSPTSPRSPTR